VVPIKVIDPKTPSQNQKSQLYLAYNMGYIGILCYGSHLGRHFEKNRVGDGKLKVVIFVAGPLAIKVTKEFKPNFSTIQQYFTKTCRPPSPPPQVAMHVTLF
jgi:hypothetical protein